MSQSTPQDPHRAARKLARIAGGLYLLSALSGGFAQFAGHEELLASEPLKTLHNLQAAKATFGASLFAWVVTLLVDISLGVLFYALLRKSGEVLAKLMGALRVVLGAMLGGNLLHHGLIWLLAYDGSTAKAFSEVQRAGWVQLLMHSHDRGFQAALMIFGIHCVLLGVLMLRSKLFPSFFAVAMALTGLAYLADATFILLGSGLHKFSELAVVVGALVAEVGFGLYLVIKGVKAPPAATGSEPAAT